MTNSPKTDNLAVHSGTLTANEIYQSVLKDYPDVLDVNEVSTILGVSSKTVYKLLNEGCTMDFLLFSENKKGRSLLLKKFPPILSSNI